jgi:hypothetical protein
MAGPYRLVSPRARRAAAFSGAVLVVGSLVTLWLLRGVWEVRGDPDGAFFVLAIPALLLGLGCLVGLRRAVLWARGWCAMFAVGIPVGYVLAMAGCERAKQTTGEVRLGVTLAFAAWHALAGLVLLAAIRAESGEGEAPPPPPAA